MKLLSALQRYVQNMAPHHRIREGGRLLIEAADELNRLQQMKKFATHYPWCSSLAPQPPQISCDCGFCEFETPEQNS